MLLCETHYLRFHAILLPKGQASGYIIVHMSELDIKYVEGELRCEEGGDA